MRSAEHVGNARLPSPDPAFTSKISMRILAEQPLQEIAQVMSPVCLGMPACALAKYALDAVTLGCLGALLYLSVLRIAGKA